MNLWIYPFKLKVGSTITGSNYPGKAFTRLN